MCDFLALLNLIFYIIQERAKMHIIVSCVSTCFLLLVIMVGMSTQKDLSGKFPNNPKDASCKWRECYGGTGKGPRLFHIRCTLLKPNSQVIYDCVYKGNPHDCSAYNNNQAKYYNDLADSAEKNHEDACSKNQISTKQCKEVTFNLIVERTRPAGKWCREVKQEL